ncbi:hypothetical protein CE91St58_68240 [Lachnospiraceae bacterium]|nr:hypothetical protein CE91St58_68240 [Lachnospiraceae bacterium]
MPGTKGREDGTGQRRRTSGIRTAALTFCIETLMAQDGDSLRTASSISIIRFWSAGFPAENAAGIFSFACFR